MSLPEFIRVNKECGAVKEMVCIGDECVAYIPSLEGRTFYGFIHTGYYRFESRADSPVLKISREEYCRFKARPFLNHPFLLPPKKLKEEIRDESAI